MAPRYHLNSDIETSALFPSVTQTNAAAYQDSQMSVRPQSSGTTFRPSRRALHRPAPLCTQITDVLFPIVAFFGDRTDLRGSGPSSRSIRAIIFRFSPKVKPLGTKAGKICSPSLYSQAPDLSWPEHDKSPPAQPVGFWIWMGQISGEKNVCLTSLQLWR